MKNLKNLVLFVTVIAFSLSACKKEDAVTDKTTQLARTWKISEYSENGFPVPVFIFANVRLTFASSGTYSHTADGDTETGNWEFNAAKDSILLDKGTINQEGWAVVELSSSKFKASYNDAGDPVVVVYVPE